MSNIDLANLASQIEFAESTVEEETDDSALDMDLKIGSPFATMFSDFSEAEEVEEAGEPKEAGETEKKKLEEETEKAKKNESAGNAGLEALNTQNGMSLVYNPFLLDTYFDHEPLEGLTDDEEDEIPAEEIPAIEEHEGVHYISKEILSLHPTAEKGLNTEFKNLVDSVINPDSPISSGSGD
jgi:hypothetical protein